LVSKGIIGPTIRHGKRAEIRPRRSSALHAVARDLQELQSHSVSLTLRLLALFLLALSQPHAGATAVLVDKLDAG
jgi:hypothetical protein